MGIKARAGDDPVPLVLAGSGGGCFGSAGLEVPAALSAVLLRYCLGRVCGVLVPFVPGCALGKLRAGRSDARLCDSWRYCCTT